MNTKPQKSWGEIQLAIAAMAMTGTLALWNVFATPDSRQVVAQTGDTATPPPDVPTQEASPSPRFIPLKIIFGGTPPKQKAVFQSYAPQSSTSKRKGGGSASSGASSAPAPAASTGSSKP